MNCFVVDLGLGNGHQASNFSFDIFLIVSLKIGDLHHGDLSIESVQEGHGNRFFTLSEEVHIREGEEPSRSS